MKEKEGTLRSHGSGIPTDTTEMLKSMVKVTEAGCRGVLVTENIILTVAHGFAPSDIHTETEETRVCTVTTMDGTLKARVSIIACDFRTDLAVLCCDHPDVYSESEWPRLREQLNVAKMATLKGRARLQMATPIPTFVFNEKNIWVKTNSKRFPHAVYVTSDALSQGTSGSAVFDSQGRVIGLISRCGLELNEDNVAIALPYVLPLFVYHDILDSSRD